MSNLLLEFKAKCRQQLGKLPESYFDQYVQGSALKLNLATFRIKDVHFAEVLFSLTFKKIQVFQEEQSDSNLHPQSRNDSKKNLKHKIQFPTKITQIFYLVNNTLIPQSNHQIRELNFLNFPIQPQWLYLITQGIEKTNYLKQLTFSNCNINDSSLQILQNCLSANFSLVSLNLSYNCLTNCSRSILKVLSVHGQRKNDITNLYHAKHTKLEFKIQNTGIYQINLENNHLSNQSLDLLIAFLYEDQWIKSINLKNNNINQEAISKFAAVINQNSVLMNVDLRQNPGFNKKYSKIIFCKLKQNIQDIKNAHSVKKTHSPIKHYNKLFETANLSKFNQSESKNQNSSQFYQNSRDNSSSFRQFSKQPILAQGKQIQSKQKIKLLTSNNSPHGPLPSKIYPFQRTMTDKKIKPSQNNRLSKRGSFAQKNEGQQIKINKTQMILNISINQLNKSQKKIESKNQEEKHNCGCQKCKEYQIKAQFNQKKLRQMEFRVLTAQKEAFELELELSKLKKFLTKNMDVSAIGSSSNRRLNSENAATLQNIQSANIQTSFNRLANSQNDDEMLSKIELLVLELTKIMETVQHLHNTENTIEQGFENVNSFSKTVSLYEKAKELMEVQQEMLEDENFHLDQFGNDSQSMIERNEAEESVLKLERGETQ